MLDILPVQLENGAQAPADERVASCTAIHPPWLATMPLRPGAAVPPAARAAGGGAARRWPRPCAWCVLVARWSSWTTTGPWPGIRFDRLATGVRPLEPYAMDCGAASRRLAERTGGDGKQTYFRRAVPETRAQALTTVRPALGVFSVLGNAGPPCSQTLLGRAGRSPAGGLGRDASARSRRPRRC